MSDEEHVRQRQRDEELKRTPLQQSDKATWPKGVRSVGLAELSEIGVDGRGRLYWQGKPVEVRKRLSLTFWQKTGAFIVAAGAAVTFLLTAASSLTVFLDWGCRIGWFAAAAVCGSP